MSVNGGGSPVETGGSGVPNGTTDDSCHHDQNTESTVLSDLYIDIGNLLARASVLIAELAMDVRVRNLDTIRQLAALSELQRFWAGSFLVWGERIAERGHPK